jgi:hypothetical protein
MNTSLSPQSSVLSELPKVALSIRQPWAWLIVNGHKDIENRSRNLANFLGPILIHAGQSCDPAEDYYACLQFLRARGLGHLINILPTLPDLERGGLVGLATIIGHGNMQMVSSWWTGPYSYVLADARPLPFQPCRGQLGFFDCAYKL